MKTYREKPLVVVADPPWRFGDSLPGKTRGAAKQYACMETVQIGVCVRDACSDHANVALFLWRVASMQEEAIAVVKAAGCTVKSELVWDKLTRTGKPHFGMGRYVRASHETCLFATRGRAFPEVNNVRSRFYGQVREHSRKPDEFYKIVDMLYPNSPKVELFARETRRGWEQHGLELGKFDG